MLTAAQMLERARPLAEEAVAKAERCAGSRMVAYEQVASTIGVSASWLRKLIKRDDSVKEIAAHEYFNLFYVYDRVCVLVEEKEAGEQKRIAQLREAANAALKGTDRLVSGVAGEATPRTSAEVNGEGD
jgi:hypothetical protein